MPGIIRHFAMMPAEGTNPEQSHAPVIDAGHEFSQVAGPQIAVELLIGSLAIFLASAQQIRPVMKVAGRSQVDATEFIRRIAATV